MVFVATTQLSHCSGKWAWKIHNESSCIAIKLYSWAFTFKFSITFMAKEILNILDFFVS